MKIVQTILRQDVSIGSLEKVHMLFDFIAPLCQDSEDTGQEDPEVSLRAPSRMHPAC